MIFDTDILIRVFRGDPSAARLVDAQAERSISVVTMIELQQGAKSRKEAAMIRRFFADLGFELMPLTEAIGFTALKLIEDHSLGSGLQFADALIAATALESGRPLATGNVRHFRPVPAIQLKSFRPSAR